MIDRKFTLQFGADMKFTGDIFTNARFTDDKLIFDEPEYHIMKNKIRSLTEKWRNTTGFIEITENKIEELIQMFLDTMTDEMGKFIYNECKSDL